MLGAFDIKYLPQTAIKGQVLADLEVEFTEGAEGSRAEEDGIPGMEVLLVSTPYLPLWKLYMDGVTNQKSFGIGIVLVSPKKITMEKSLRLGFLATNNEAEYEAFLAGMIMVKKIEGKSLEVFSDSRLIVEKVKGEFEARDQRMQWYLGKIRQLQSSFKVFSIKQVPRSKNSHTNSLATLATSLG